MEKRKYGLVIRHDCGSTYYNLVSEEIWNWINDTSNSIDPDMSPKLRLEIDKRVEAYGDFDTLEDMYDYAEEEDENINDLKACVADADIIDDEDASFDSVKELNAFCKKHNVSICGEYELWL